MYKSTHIYIYIYICGKLKSRQPTSFRDVFEQNCEYFEFHGLDNLFNDLRFLINIYISDINHSLVPRSNISVLNQHTLWLIGSVFFLRNQIFDFYSLKSAPLHFSNLSARLMRFEALYWKQMVPSNLQKGMNKEIQAKGPILNFLSTKIARTNFLPWQFLPWQTQIYLQD